MEARSDAFELKGEARDRGVETPARDHTQSSALAPNSRLLSRRSENARLTAATGNQPPRIELLLEWSQPDTMRTGLRGSWVAGCRLTKGIRKPESFRGRQLPHVALQLRG